MKKSNLRAGCKAGCSLNKKRDFMERMDAFQEYLLRGTYILSSCLIIFSLMMYNGLMSSSSYHSGNFVTVMADNLNYAVQDIWYDTALAAEAVGSNFDKLCLGAFRSSTDGLGRLFAATGNTLAAVSEVLATPPYAYARGD